MKRDMELVRKILFFLEKDGHESKAYEHSWFDDATDEVFFHHAKIMEQADLIECFSYNKADNLGVAYFPTQLTWNGHELLDAVRHDTVWEKIKSTLGPALSSVPIQIVSGVGMAALKVKFGLSN